MSNIKKLVLTAMFIAIGVVLPMAFHTIPGAGGIFLPMHIPVLLAGIILGFPFGFACGVLTPLLASFITGMPPLGILPPMMFELAAYGTVSSLLMHLGKTKNIYLRIYLSLLGAMLIGRIIFGILNAFIFSVGEYSMQIWVTAAFITALPGIIIQIVLIPPVVIILQKARLIELDSKAPRLNT